MFAVIEMCLFGCQGCVMFRLRCITPRRATCGWESQDVKRLEASSDRQLILRDARGAGAKQMDGVPRRLPRCCQVPERRALCINTERRNAVYLVRRAVCRTPKGRIVVRRRREFVPYLLSCPDKVPDGESHGGLEGEAKVAEARG